MRLRLAVLIHIHIGNEAFDQLFFPYFGTDISKNTGAACVDRRRLEAGDLAEPDRAGEGHPVELHAYDILGRKEHRDSHQAGFHEPFRGPPGKKRAVVVQVFPFYEPVRHKCLKTHLSPPYLYDLEFPQDPRKYMRRPGDIVTDFTYAIISWKYR